MDDRELNFTILCMCIGSAVFNIVVSLVVVVIALVIHLPLVMCTRLVLGVLIGFILSVLSILHTASGLNISVDLDEDRAKAYATRQSLVRIAVFVIVLVVVARFVDPYMALMIAVGVMGIKLGAYLTPLIKKILKEKDA